MDDLSTLRENIDQLDKEMINMFLKRMKIVSEIADFKALNNLEILDESREKKVLAKTEYIQDQIIKKYAAVFLQDLMKVSKQLQQEHLSPNRLTNKAGQESMPENDSDDGAGRNIKEEASIKENNLVVENVIKNTLIEENSSITEDTTTKEDTSIIGELTPKGDLSAKDIKIGFQGIPGSYSEEAWRKYFGENVSSNNYVNFEDVFNSLQTGDIDYGVLPIENSFTGGIAEVYDLLCNYGFYIVGEKCVAVDHNLLALNGAKAEDIREVYSHPQALQQCSKFLRTNSIWHMISCTNTAVSAKIIKDSKSLSKAAIASSRAAELYGLTILAKGISNNVNNSTRFIIIGRKDEQNKYSDKISLALAIPHEPGSLHRILGWFSANKINMLKIESRPMPERTWEYLFYIDVEGNMANPEMKQTLENIAKDSTFFRLLGNYRSDKSY